MRQRQNSVCHAESKTERRRSARLEAVLGTEDNDMTERAFGRRKYNILRRATPSFLPTAMATEFFGVDNARGHGGDERSNSAP